MDVNTLRSLITVLCFVAFIGIVLWAYSGSRRSRFDEAANLPFSDDDIQQETISRQGSTDALTQERANG